MNFSIQDNGKTIKYRGQNKTSSTPDVNKVETKLYDQENNLVLKKTGNRYQYELELWLPNEAEVDILIELEKSQQANGAVYFSPDVNEFQPQQFWMWIFYNDVNVLERHVYINLIAVNPGELKEDSINADEQPQLEKGVAFQGLTSPKIGDLQLSKNVASEIEYSAVLEDVDMLDGTLHRYFEWKIDGSIKKKVTYKIENYKLTASEKTALKGMDGQNVIFYPHGDFDRKFYAWISLYFFQLNKYDCVDIEVEFGTDFAEHQNPILPQPKPPLILSFLLNGEDIYSDSSTVTATNITRWNPTHYKISRYDNFSDANWIEYEQEFFYELYQSGLNTLYFITKNEVGESNIKTAQIGWAGTEDHTVSDTVPVLDQIVVDEITINNQTRLEEYNDTVPEIEQIVTDSAIVTKEIL